MEFVFELAAEDGAASATGSSRISPLNHEVGNDAVEDDIVVFSRVGKAGEVLTSSWGFVREKDNSNVTIVGS